MKNRKPSWKFTVSSIDDVDVNRILRETPQGEPWVVITDKLGTPVLICIRDEYLERFSFDDNIKVCGTRLYGCWGLAFIPCFGHDDGRLTASSTGNQSVLDGWRVSYNSLHLEAEDDVRTLVRANKYVRRVPVRVYTASDCE
jgi:hypothetical protein